MKSNLSILVLALSLGACAAMGEKPSTSSTAADIAPTPQGSMSAQMGQIQQNQQTLNKMTNPAPSPRTVSQDMSWGSFELMVIQMDKNKKPQRGEKISFEDHGAMTPFGQVGPKIAINTFPNGQSIGKVLQVACGGNDIKQKFDAPNLLKGWAVELSCPKANYFLMINAK